MYQAKYWTTKHSKGNKTVPGKVAKTCTEDGHRQTTKKALQYKPKGRRNIRRPRRRWRDKLQLDDQGTENTPNNSGI